MKMTSILAVLALFLFFLPALALAGLTLKWNPNTEGDLAGYKLYYGTNCPDGPFDGTELDQGASPIDISLGTLENQSYPFFAVTSVSTKSICFRLTAYDLAGNESNFSNWVNPKIVQRVAGVSGSFSDPSDILGWDNNVFYAFGGSAITITSDFFRSGPTAMKIYGGWFSGARFTVRDLEVGETVVFRGWVTSRKTGGIPGIKPIILRLNGENQTNWTQEEVLPGQDWKYFATSKIVSPLDVLGLDINVFNLDGTEEIYLDDVEIQVTKTVFSSNFENSNDLLGWDNHVFYVEGGAQLDIDVQNFYEGSSSLKISGGVHNGARFTIDGLTAGDSVIVSRYLKSTGTNYTRLNSTNQTDWTQKEMLSNGDWQYLEMEKILNSSSLDVNFFNISSPNPVYVDSVKVRVGKLVYGSGFENPADLSGWDNHVSYIEGGASLTLDTSVHFSGNSSLKIWGGLHNAARLQICELLPGDKLVFLGLVASAGAKDVYIRTNTASQTDWTQSSISPNASWRPFYQEKIAGGFCSDFNVFSVNSDSSIFLDDVRIEVR